MGSFKYSEWALKCILKFYSSFFIYSDFDSGANSLVVWRAI